MEERKVVEGVEDLIVVEAAEEDQDRGALDLAEVGVVDQMATEVEAPGTVVSATDGAKEVGVTSILQVIIQTTSSFHSQALEK